MAKESEQVFRVDLRIPMMYFSKIEALAETTNQDFTPTTKPNNDGSLKRDKEGNEITPKRAVTPVILDLISIALDSLERGNISEDSISSNKTSLGVDTEKKILDTLLAKMEGMLSDKLSDMIEDKFNSYVSNPSHETILNTPSAPQPVTVLSEDKPTKEVNKRGLDQSPAPSAKTKSNDELPEVIDASLIKVKEITPDIIDKGLQTKELGLRFRLKFDTFSDTNITKKYPKEFDKEGKINEDFSIAREKFIKWSMDKDPEGIGWDRLKKQGDNDKQFYPITQE